MGMFDSFYDKNNVEWQSKAFGCVLSNWDVGDVIPGPPIDYQAEVLGGQDKNYEWGYVTISGGRFAGVTSDRDYKVPLRLYSGDWIRAGE